jgi:hypothetical protein
MSLLLRLGCILFLFQIYAAPSFATIELISFDADTVSYAEGFGDDEDNDPTIYAGTAGDSQCTTGDETCNNCSTNTSITQTCNEDQVHANTELTITFRSTTVAGATEIGDTDGGTISGLSLINPGSNVAANSTHTLKVKWGNLCSLALGIDGDCREDGDQQITVGVDGNGDGSLDDSEDDKISITIVVQFAMEAQSVTCDSDSLDSNDGMCDFSVYPGDQKVYLQDPSVPTNFPVGQGKAQYNRVILYCAGGVSSFSDITHNDKCGEFDIEVDDDGDVSVTPTSIDGLENDVEYFFVAATVDKAGNIGYHSNPDNLVQGTHSATPSEVTGLLSSDIQCFIATAAYGSPFEKHVVTLRVFRDRYLKTSELGRWFVRQYYHYSPPLAQFIAQRPWLKQLTRWALKPIVFFAELMLDSPEEKK